MKKIIDVSGYGHSGKTVVTDYLKQFECVFSFPNNVEFELFRVSGGLVDLYYSIFESWSLIRSTDRLKEFRYLVKRIGTVPSRRNPLSYLRSSGHSYDLLFNNQFLNESNKLFKTLTKGSHKGFWPYENLRSNSVKLFFNKIKFKLFNSLVESEIYYSDRELFISEVQNYLNALFNHVSTQDHTHILLNNAFEPYNPDPCLHMAGDSFSIIVDRDPRDIYASQLNLVDKYIPEYEKKRNIDKIKMELTNLNDINKFIFRYKMLKKNIRNINNDRILRINYEDFVLKHDHYSVIVKDLLQLSDKSIQSATGFDVSASKKNIGIWKNIADSKEIKLIESELSEYCYLGS